MMSVNISFLNEVHPSIFVVKNCAIWRTVCQKFQQNSVLYAIPLEKYF